MKVFISHAMRGISDEEVKRVRNMMIDKAKSQYGDIEIVDSWFGDFNGTPLQFLAKSIDKLAEADAAIFCPGWQDARGCRIEHQCCKDYEILILYD